MSPICLCRIQQLISGAECLIQGPAGLHLTYPCREAAGIARRFGEADALHDIEDFPETLGRVGQGAVGQEDKEFFTAHTTKQIVKSNTRDESATELDENSVSTLVSVAVVHVLEVIDINERNDVLPENLLLELLGKPVSQRLHDVAPVGNAGQLVGP